MTEIRGSFPVMITPMDQQQEVDFGGLKNNIEFFISKGAKGLCALGSTGEFVSLTKEERLQIAEEVVKTVNGRVPVLIGTAAETTRDAVEYTRHAKDIGADGALIINSYYCKPHEDEIYDHFKAITEAADIPVMLYNNPFTSGVDMSTELILRIARDFDTVTHIKESSGNIRKLREITEAGKGFVKTFCGWDDMALESFLVGATGWISVAGNTIPAEVTQLFELAVEKREIEEAWALYNKILPLLQFIEGSGKYVQVSKRALELMGQAGGPSRAPRKGLNATEDAALKQVLKDLSII